MLVVEDHLKWFKLKILIMLEQEAMILNQSWTLDEVKVNGNFIEHLRKSIMSNFAFGHIVIHFKAE